MSDTVYVPGQTADNATLLLAAAEELEHEPFVVATVDGGFNVPADVAEKAGFDEYGRPKSRTAKKAAKAAGDDSGDQPKPARRRSPRKAAAPKAEAPAQDADTPKE